MTRMTPSDLWQHFEIAGKPAEILQAGKSSRGVVIFLHNARGESLSISPRFTEELLKRRLTCICPWGDATWWSDRIVAEYDPLRSAEAYVVESVVKYAKEQAGGNLLALLGISMGGQGALRIAFKHPEAFPVVAAIAPAIEHHAYYGQGSPIDAMYASKEHCRQDSVPMHVHPTNVPAHIYFCADPDDDYWFRGADRLHEKLGALGVQHECDLTMQAGGHTWDYFNAMAQRTIEFISGGLAQQSRKLL
jgi:S-formylglutathione hydrolase